MTVILILGLYYGILCYVTLYYAMLCTMCYAMQYACHVILHYMYVESHQDMLCRPTVRLDCVMLCYYSLFCYDVLCMLGRASLLQKVTKGMMN